MTRQLVKSTNGLWIDKLFIPTWPLLTSLATRLRQRNRKVKSRCTFRKGTGSDLFVQPFSYQDNVQLTSLESGVKPLTRTNPLTHCDISNAIAPSYKFSSMVPSNAKKSNRDSQTTFENPIHYAMKLGYLVTLLLFSGRLQSSISQHGVQSAQQPGGRPFAKINQDKDDMVSKGSIRRGPRGSSIGPDLRRQTSFRCFCLRGGKI